MDKRTRQTIEKYEAVCNAVYEQFCAKNGYDTQSDPWVGDNVGEVAEVTDSLFANLTDMLTDLKEDAPEGAFLEWYDYDDDCVFYGLRRLNYHAWLHGAPRYTKEQIERIKDLHDAKLYAEYRLKKLIDEINNGTYKPY